MSESRMPYPINSPSKPSAGPNTHKYHPIFFFESYFPKGGGVIYFLPKKECGDRERGQDKMVVTCVGTHGLRGQHFFVVQLVTADRILQKYKNSQTPGQTYIGIHLIHARTQHNSLNLGTHRQNSGVGFQVSRLFSPLKTFCPSRCFLVEAQSIVHCPQYIHVCSTRYMVHARIAHNMRGPWVCYLARNSPEPKRDIYTVMIGKVGPEKGGS